MPHRHDSQQALVRSVRAKLGQQEHSLEFHREPLLTREYHHATHEPARGSEDGAEGGAVAAEAGRPTRHGGGREGHEGRARAPHALSPHKGGVDSGRAPLAIGRTLSKEEELHAEVR